MALVISSIAVSITFALIGASSASGPMMPRAVCSAAARSLSSESATAHLLDETHEHLRVAALLPGRRLRVVQPNAEATEPLAAQLVELVHELRRRADVLLVVADRIVDLDDVVLRSHGRAAR